MITQIAESARLSNAPIEHLVAATQSRMIHLVQSLLKTELENVPTSAHAAAYHLATGGQRLRMRLALHAALALGLAEADAAAIATSVELLHNASLVHDDLQDRGTMRRGQPSVWAAFGDDVAICAGDLLLSSAYAALAAFSKTDRLPALIELIHARTARAIAGQCADLAAKDSRILDIMAYERIAIAKSGALLGLPLELALTATGHPHACVFARQAADAFSIGYQIVDDLEDFAQDAGADGQPSGLNIFHILGAASDRRRASAVARTIGLRQFGIAAAAAALLPDQSGALLREMALRLSARL